MIINQIEEDKMFSTLDPGTLFWDAGHFFLKTKPLLGKELEANAVCVEDGEYAFFGGAAFVTPYPRASINLCTRAE